MDPLRRQFHALLAEAEAEEVDRHVNLSVRVDGPTGQPLYRAGGVWDRLTQRYTGWKQPHVITLRPSQVEAAQEILFWLQERKAGRERDYCANFFIGDRGGGKTALLVIAAGLFALEFPRLDGTASIGWLVSKSHNERDELDREMRHFFPFEGRWWIYSEYRGHVYRWVHGPTLKNLSADDEDALKQGRVDFAGFNEAGKFSKKVPAFGLGRIKDKGGYAVFTSNKPTARSRWILNWYAKAAEAKEQGAPYPVRFLTIRSDANDTLDKRTADQVDQLVNDIAPDLSDTNLDALFDPLEPLSYPKFSKKPGGNVAPPPDLGDVTREFTRRLLSSRGLYHPTGYDFLASADFQYHPGIVATWWRVFGTLDNPIFWACDELEVPHCSEEQFLAEVAETTGYTPANTLWTGDNTGDVQSASHDPKERTSFEVWRAEGWKIIHNVRPKDSTHRPNNVRVERRVGLTNHLLERPASLPGDQRVLRHLMVSDRCPRLIGCFEKCENKISGKNGMPYPAHPWSHLTDTAGYLAWCCWPKPQKPATKVPRIFESVPIKREGT